MIPGNTIVQVGGELITLTANNREEVRKIPLEQ